MRGTIARRGIVVTFGSAVITLLIGAVAWACTMPVGQTNVAPPAGAPGDSVTASGTVSNTAEEFSRCSGDSLEVKSLVDAECEYEFGIVDPAQVGDPNPQWDGSGGDGVPGPTCHYETPQTFGIEDPDGSQTVNEEKQLHKVSVATHVPSASGDGERALTASGKVPNFDSEQSGETVACFYSKQTVDDDGEATNGQNNGAATATVPQPFLVVE